jgi:hypothetical protein
MSEVFEGYERQYCEASASLSRKCTAASALDGGKQAPLFNLILLHVRSGAPAFVDCFGLILWDLRRKEEAEAVRDPVRHRGS